MTTPQTAETLISLTADLPAGAYPLAYTMLHFDQELPQNIRAGLFHTLEIIIPLQPLTRVDEALGTLLALGKMDMTLASVRAANRAAWQVIDECEARANVEAALAWWSTVQALSDGDGVTVH